VIDIWLLDVDALICVLKVLKSAAVVPATASTRPYVTLNGLVPDVRMYTELLCSPELLVGKCTTISVVVFGWNTSYLNSTWTVI
jgi:hypothetical protein